MAKLELSAQPRPEHAAYISHWIKLLREDNRAIFTAAARAQQATDWLFREQELRQQKGEEKATSEMKPEPAIAADLTPPESIELHAAVPEKGEAPEHAQGNSPAVEAAPWKMHCLICPPEDRHEYRNLVAIQEHAMDDHGYTQEDHRNVARTKVSPNHYQWTFPDGRTWLDAVKTAEIVRDQGDVQQEAKAQQEQAASRRETVMPTAEERRLNRVETAERALSVYTDQDREANLTDLLADAMHWSKQEGIDFERCLERARAHYRTEVHEAQQELSREAEKHEERGIGR